MMSDNFNFPDAIAVEHSRKKPFHWIGLAFSVALALLAIWSGSRTKPIDAGADSTAPTHLRDRQPFKAVKNIEPFKTVIDRIDPAPIYIDTPGLQTGA